MTCIERAAYKPSIGRFKVFMIDEAHQLTKDAFNALLKTLEEPPEYLKFVLATTDPEKMLPTVLSRCLQFNLRPMAPETVREHLQQRAAGRRRGQRRRRAAAAGACGARFDARRVVAHRPGHCVRRRHARREQGVRDMLGSVDREHAAALGRGAWRYATAPACWPRSMQLRSLGLSADGTLE